MTMSIANVSTTMSIAYVSTTPISVVNSNWFSDFITFYLRSIIYRIVGIALNTVILIINAKKKREKEHTYRVVIVYISSMAITKDISTLYFYLYNSILSGAFQYYLYDYYQFWYDANSDITGLLISYSQPAFQMLITLFSINRFLAIIHPIAYVFIQFSSSISLIYAIRNTFISNSFTHYYCLSFSRFMTTKRVHIYCISIIVFVVIGWIIDQFDGYVLNYYNISMLIILYIVSTAAEIIITPITTIWVIVTLLLHLQVLNNLNDRKGIIEMLLISCALLIQCIYAIVVLLPFCVYQILSSFDFQAYMAILYVSTYNSNGVFVNSSESSSFLAQWLFFAEYVAEYGPDTVFYALNMLIVVRVYSTVIWQIPVGIYRLIRKLKKTKTINVIHVMPMNSTNNQPQSSPKNVELAEVQV